MLLRFQVSWNVTPCRLVNPTDVSKDLDALIFKVIKSTLYDLERNTCVTVGRLARCNFPVVLTSLEGTRRRGRPRKRWKEEAERDLQVLGVRRWTELVADRKKMEGHCSTRQSPQWAVMPMEEGGGGCRKSWNCQSRQPSTRLRFEPRTCCMQVTVTSTARSQQHMEHVSNL